MPTSKTPMSLEPALMTLPKPLVLFLAFCGGAAIFATPLVLGAIAFGAGGNGAGAPSSEAPVPTASASADAGSGEILGDLEFHAFDLGFEPASIEVEEPGRYTVTFVNDGAVLHDITFADGTVVEAEPGESGTGEIVVPAEGLGYICSIPGHADGGMEGAITVTGSNPDEVPHSGSGHEPGANAEIEPDPEAPEYVPREATAPDLAEGDVHEIELVVSEREMTVAPGVVQTVWTFDDSVPGPVLRVKVGDTVRVTLVNPDTNQLPHSIDFHASLVAWNDEMRSINPGEELVYEFVAKYAGVYMYHCGTTPALHHIAQGMFGMIIVEPEGGLAPVEHEYALVQNEWYMVEQAGFISLEEASRPRPRRPTRWSGTGSPTSTPTTRSRCPWARRCVSSCSTQARASTRAPSTWSARSSTRSSRRASTSPRVTRATGAARPWTSPRPRAQSSRCASMRTACTRS